MNFKSNFITVGITAPTELHFCKQKDKEVLKSKTPLSIRKEYTVRKLKKQGVFIKIFQFSEY